MTLRYYDDPESEYLHQGEKESKCLACNGKGEKNDVECDACEGTGRDVR